MTTPGARSCHKISRARSRDIYISGEIPTPEIPATHLQKDTLTIKGRDDHPCPFTGVSSPSDPESPEILPQELTGVSIYLNLVTLLSHEEVMLHDGSAGTPPLR